MYYVFIIQFVMFGQIAGYPPIERSQLRSLYSAGGTLGTLGAIGYRMARTRSGKRFRGNMPYRRNVRPRTNRRSTFRRMPVEGRGVTTQHDRQQIYRKTSMPMFKKKAWKRFSKKVNAISERELGSQTIIFNTQRTDSNSVVGNHGLGVYGLYSQQSTAPQLNDLKQISGVVNDTGDFTNALGVIVKDSTKYIFKSGILDLTIRNTSFFTGDGNLNTACSLEVDLYEITVRKVGNDNATNFNTLIDYFDKASNITPNIGNTTGAGIGQVQLNKRGVTPWDLPMALSEYGIKIWKKTKFFVGNGQTATYQYRDPKRHIWSQNGLLNVEGVNRKSTRHLLVIFKAIPGIVVGPVAGNTTEQLTVGCTRKYLYKVEGNNENRDLLITN